MEDHEKDKWSYLYRSANSCMHDSLQKKISGGAEVNSYT